jgi:HAE1 family hydrophobic/amphiphilic exporter-1
MNRGILADHGLALEQVYDETTYVHSSIALVRTNLLVGGLLAAAVLLAFLRSGSSTFVIALAIPISAIGTFLVMALLGRTLNVVSLAGMTFAVGMLVDNAIVILENIYRTGSWAARGGWPPSRERRGVWRRPGQHLTTWPCSFGALRAGGGRTALPGYRRRHQRGGGSSLSCRSP